MGLAIGVGVLAELLDTGVEEGERMERDLAYINTLLKEKGLPEHHEPQAFEEEPQTRASLTSFPYSWLHFLRRFAAHVMRDPKWVPYPIEPGEDPAEDQVLRQMYRRLDSHLLCHSDREGYYLPVDFEDLFLDSTHKIRGGVVGSSYQLQKELLGLTDPLEIEIDEQGELSEEKAKVLSQQRPSGAPFALERLVWLALYEAARLSIKHKTAIVFY